MRARLHGLPPYLRDAGGKLSGKIEHAEAGLQTITDGAGKLWAWNPFTNEWEVVHVLAGQLNNLWSVSGHYYGTPSAAGSNQIYAVPQNQPILGADKKSAFAGETILIPGLPQPAPPLTGSGPAGTTPTGITVPGDKPTWWPGDWAWPPVNGATPTSTTGGTTVDPNTPAPTGTPTDRPAWWPGDWPWPPVPGVTPTGTTTTGLPTGLPTGGDIVPVGTTTTTTTTGDKKSEPLSTNAKIAIGAGVVLVTAVGAYFIFRKKRRGGRRRG